MELLELMKQRRSIRKYLDKKVEKEKLDKILEAYDLGISSCIVGRAEATFSHPEMA